MHIRSTCERQKVVLFTGYRRERIIRGYRRHREREKKADCSIHSPPWAAAYEQEPQFWVVKSQWEPTYITLHLVLKANKGFWGFESFDVPLSQTTWSGFAVEVRPFFMTNAWRGLTLLKVEPINALPQVSFKDFTPSLIPITEVLHKR